MVLCWYLYGRVDDVSEGQTKNILTTFDKVIVFIKNKGLLLMETMTSILEAGRSVREAPLWSISLIFQEAVASLR